jgi:YHS domain-containing protein
MKNKNYRTVLTISLMVFMAAGMALNGCKKSEPASSEITAEDTQQAADQEAKEAEALIAKLSTEAKEVIEQTICPVMAGKINKDIFVEYKGQKVYFCCAGCEAKFKADPEKYISKLPQFQK